VLDRLAPFFVAEYLLVPTPGETGEREGEKTALSH
jgi:hypothetical protein